MTVAELLAASRASHAEYRQLAVKGKKPEGWQGHLFGAMHWRRCADQLDPQHADAAWSEDSPHANHEALMAFYEQQLGLKDLKNGEGAARR